MDLSKLSDSDLQALRSNNFQALSDDGLLFLKQATAAPLSEEEIAERQGFTSAFGAGFGQFLTSGMRGLGELTGSETLTEAARRRTLREQAEPGFIPTTEEDVTKAFEEGLISGVGAAGRKYLAEPAGELLGSFAAPAVATVAAIPAAKALGLGALGTFALTGAATALAELPSAVGDTLYRMEQEGQPADVERATAFAIPQAVLYGFGLPGVGVLPRAAQRLFRSQADEVAEQVLAGKLTKEQATERLSGTLSNIIKETAIAGGAGATIVTGAEALKRAAAGQELTDEEAIDAYLEQALAAGAIAPLFGVPIGGLRGRGARRQIEEAGAAREAQVAAERRAEEEAAAQQAELAQRGMLFSPEEMGGERVGPELPREEVEAAPTFSRFELQQKEQVLTDRLDDLRTRIEQAATARDFDTLEALTGQAKTLQEELAATSAQLKEAGGAFKSPEQLQKELDSRTKALQKAAAEGDTEKVTALIPKVRESEQALAQAQQAAQPDDLFARADRREAEGRARVDEELAKQTEEFQALVAQSRDASDDTLRRLEEDIEALPEIIQKTSDEQLIARMDEILQQATQNNASQYARTSDDRSQREILQNQEKIERLKRTMQEVVESGDLRPIPRLRNRLAELISQSATGRPEIARNRALEDQMAAVEVVRSNIEDIRAGRFLGEGTRDPSLAASTQEGLVRKSEEAVASYADAAIREVNALRKQNNQKPLTVTEATRLAMDVRGHLEKAVKNRNQAALQIGKGNISPIEKQLAQIKKKYHKGEPLRRRVEGQVLRQTFEQAPEAQAARRQQQIQEAAEQLPLLQQKLEAVRAQVNPNQNVIRQLEAEVKRVSALAQQAPTLQAQRVTAIENRLRAVRAQASPDQNVIRQLETELERARRGEDVKPEVRRAEDDVSLFQDDRAAQLATRGREQDLFGAEAPEIRRLREEKGEPQLQTATVRATPENFMRYLRSGAVQKMRADIAEANRTLTDLVKRSPAKRKVDPDLPAQLERQRQFVSDVERADKLAANLRRNASELWTMRGDAQKALRDAEKELSAAKKGKKPEADIRRAQNLVNEYREGLRRVDAETPLRLKEIDALHKKANDLLEANLATEKAILRQLETRYKKQTAPSAEATKLENDMRAARAQIGRTEAAIRNQREEANKTQRIAEQARLEATAQRPKVRREIVETKFQTPGAEQRVLRKKTTKVEPKTQKEIDLAQKRKQADVAEQLAARRAAAKNRTLQKALADESRLKKELEKTRNKIKQEQAYAAALKSDKAKEKAQTRIKQLLEQETAIKKQLDDLGLVGSAVERALVFKGDKPAREERKRPLRMAGEKAPGAVQLKKSDEAQRKAFNKFYEQFEEFYTNKKSAIDVDDYLGPDGTAFRALPPAVKAIDPTEATALGKKLDAAVPDGIKFKSVGNFSDLPQDVKDQLARDNGIVDGTDASLAVRGFVLPNGDVYVIRNNHRDALDLQATYVHELVGHVSADRLLGNEGIGKLSERIEAMPEGAYGLARTLGIEENFRGAMADMALTIKKMSDEGKPKADIDRALKNMEITAARELLAYTAEKRVTEDLRQKLGRWYKEIIGAFRDWMRKSGMAELAKVTDADIYNIIRKAMRNYNKNEVGAFRKIDGDVAFRKFASNPNPALDPGIASTVGKVVQKDPSLIDNIKATASGMKFLHRFVDRFAGLDYIARTAFKDSLEGVQMMYYNRIADQRSNMVANVATNGPVRLVKNEEDGTFQYKSANKPSLKQIFETLKGAQKEFGNERFTVDTFGTYLAIERAAADKGGLAAGMKKLDLSGKITLDEAQRMLKVGRANEAFQKARQQYREYNDGLIDLLVDTGRISKEQAADYKRADYVPYYRERDGEIWDVEHNVRVGDIKTQPYLRQLVGGDSAIVNFEVGALQNTYLLTDMALSNIATKNTAFTLQTLGAADIAKGKGTAGPTTVRFYKDGEEHFAVLSTRGNALKLEERLAKMRADGKTNSKEYKALAARADKAKLSENLFGDIPAELIVKGMDGMSLELPLAIKFMQAPANLLRKAVTRNPAYAARIALKDSLYGWIATGSDVKPVIGVLGNLKGAWTGKQPAIKKLQEQGIIGGHVFNGTVDDMRTVALQLARGEKGWEKAMAKADRLAILADEAARVTLYDGFIKKGMTEMEATLATLEAQNFTKHGFSPSVRYLSTMIPFFNAQIQGLNVFARALAGKSLFEDKLGVRTAALQRGGLLAGGTMLYATLMQDNEAYQNATPQDRLNYWFVSVPFFDEPIRVPIPFEAGLVFKALPEAIVNYAMDDPQSKEVLNALGKLTLASVPGSSNLFLPQGVKPLIELATNTSFFGFRPIEGLRAQQEQAGFRFGPQTTEVSKAIGELLNVSPLKIDHFINGYTSSLGIALLSAFNPILRDTTTPAMKASEFSIVGGFFQPVDGTGIINKVYEDMQEIEQIGTTFKRMAERDPKAAQKYLEKYTTEIELKSLAGAFRQEMGELNTAERAVRADQTMSAAEKRKFMDDIRRAKIELASLYREAIR